VARRLATVWRVRSRPVLAAVVLSVALTGCSAEEGPPPSPSSPSASSASAPETPVPTSSSAAPAAPELPAAATTFDAAGAEAFVRHFWDVVNHAYATGDTDPVLAISDTGCGACQSLVENARAVTDAGGSFVGLEFQTSDYLSQAPNGEGRSLVSGLLAATPDAYVLNAQGERERLELPETRDFQIITSWSGGKWLLYSVSSFADGSAR
jgi:hypothetical protein